MLWACWCSLDRCWSALNHRARFQLAQAVSVCLAVGRMGQVRMLSWRLKCHQVSQSLRTPMFLGVLSCGFYSSGFYKFTFQSHFMVCLFPLLLLLVSSCTILFFTGTEPRVTLQLPSPQVKRWRQLLKPKQRWMQHQVLQWNLQLRKILHPFDILASLSPGPHRNERHGATELKMKISHWSTGKLTSLNLFRNHIWLSQAMHK